MLKPGPWVALLAVASPLLLASQGCASARRARSPATPAPQLLMQPLHDGEAATPVHARAAEAPAGARSHLLATFTLTATGPFAARSSRSALAAWMATSEADGAIQLVVDPLTADGVPISAPQIVAAATREPTSLLVRPAEKGPAADWLVLWSSLLDRGESLSMVPVSAGGRPGKPVDVRRTGDHIVWSDLLPLAHEALCVWTEETPNGDANLLVAPVDAKGPRGVPARVARGISGWAAAAGDDGAAVALVSSPPDAAAGSLSLLRLDAQGQASAPIPIGAQPTVSGDVDMVRLSDGWLLAWTDRTGEDPQIALAKVDDGGHVQGPSPALHALGGSTLAGLAAGPAGVALAWQEAHAQKHAGYALHLASVDTGPTLAAQPVVAVSVTRSMTPELVATPDGFAVLADAPTCAGDTPTCSGPDTRTVIRFDARLAPVQTEPLRVTVGAAHALEPSPVNLAWSLDCSTGTCLALAATSGRPTSVFTTEVAPRDSPFRAPLLPPPPPAAPRVATIATLAAQPFADLAVARAGDAALVATLAVPDTNAGHQANEGNATVAVRLVDGEGHASAPAIASSRARGVGRVAVAAAPGAAGGGAVAWVAIDGGDPQVHLTRIDARGKIGRDVQLTTAKGDATDVALAWAQDGWLVGWVDGRDGNGEVYTAKVSRDLDRIGPGQRITKAPGDAADVALSVRGDVAWLAWSDPRESPSDGIADIYVTTVRAKDASPTGNEIRVLATAAHSRSPSIVATDRGAVVAWLEDAPPGVDAPGAAMIARLGPDGHVQGAPSTLNLGGAGRPTAIALTADAEEVRAVVARAAREETTLDALHWPVGADAPARLAAYALLDLDAPPSFEVALALSGDALYYVDTGPSAQVHRLRRAVLAWRHDAP